jgi:hydrogenase expression/formation protein HypE
LAHGGGGSASADLLKKYFLPAYGNSILNQLGDQAVIKSPEGRLAFTTDSFVVDPIFFPGGDIGSLAVHGTVNDLAVCGAIPRYLSVGLILEEGFLLDDLESIAKSIAEAAKTSGVQVVTGDTKVVARGNADRIFINTSGIGELLGGIDIRPDRVKPGNKIILNGTIGDHGIAVLMQRKELNFEVDVKSDSAPLYDLVKTMLDVEPQITMMRDITRGGLASALNEIAQSSKTGIVIEEAAIPVLVEVKSVCEILGFDPLYIANEGKLAAFVPGESADKVLKAMKNHPLGENAAIIGEVSGESDVVEMKTRFGGNRVVAMQTGEQLPRIC